MYDPNPSTQAMLSFLRSCLLLRKKLPKTFMKCGPQAELPKAGLTVKRRTTDLKTTPLLIPYDELAESEKEYDRNTAA